MNNAIGLLTPPVGPVLNVVAGVARGPGPRDARRMAFSRCPGRAFAAVHHVSCTGHGAGALVLLNPGHIHARHPLRKNGQQSDGSQ